MNLIDFIDDMFDVKPISMARIWERVRIKSSGKIELLIHYNRNAKEEDVGYGFARLSKSGWTRVSDIK